MEEQPLDVNYLIQNYLDSDISEEEESSESEVDHIQVVTPNDTSDEESPPTDSGSVEHREYEGFWTELEQYSEETHEKLLHYCSDSSLDESSQESVRYDAGKYAICKSRCATNEETGPDSTEKWQKTKSTREKPTEEVQMNEVLDEALLLWSEFVVSELKSVRLTKEDFPPVQSNIRAQFSGLRTSEAQYDENKDLTTEEMKEFQTLLTPIKIDLPTWSTLRKSVDELEVCRPPNEGVAMVVGPSMKDAMEQVKITNRIVYLFEYELKADEDLFKLYRNYVGRNVAGCLLVLTEIRVAVVAVEGTETLITKHFVGFRNSLIYGCFKRGKILYVHTDVAPYFGSWFQFRAEATPRMTKPGETDDEMKLLELSDKLHNVYILLNQPKVSLSPKLPKDLVLFACHSRQCRSFTAFIQDITSIPNTYDDSDDCLTGEFDRLNSLSESDPPVKPSRETNQLELELGMEKVNCLHNDELQALVRDVEITDKID